jgi:hypothetical protein
VIKRYRSPRPTDNQLRAQWGKLPHEDPDLLYVWGAGTHPADSRLLDYMLSGKRYRPLEKEWGNSFLEELEERGYDITTLKFSIDKLKD